MKRSLIVYAIPFTIGILVSLKTPLSLHVSQFALAAIVILIALTGILHFLKLHLMKTVLFGVTCGMLFASCYMLYFVEPIRALDSESVRFHAVVQQYPDVYEEEQRVEVKVQGRELGLPILFGKVRLLIYVPRTSEKLVPGDSLELEATLYRASTLEGFERDAYFSAKGIFLLGRYNQQKESTDAVYFQTAHPEHKPIWTFPLHIAFSLKENIDALYPEREAGFLKGILFGDKSGMPANDTAALRKSGLSHIAAVSGLHIGFLVGFCFLLFGRKWGSIISIVLILFFIAMVGATPSVLRAGIMYIMIAVAYTIGRENDSLNALALALIVQLISNPYAIFNLSLQLSFAASFGLILFGGRLQGTLFRHCSKFHVLPSKWMKAVTSGISCSVCALFFTTPIILASFGYVSILSPIANLFTIGIIGILFVVGLLTAILSGVFPAIATVLATPLKYVVEYVLLIAHKISDFPYGLVYWENPYGKMAIIATYFLILLTLCLPKYAKARITTPIICAVVVVLTALGMHENTLTFRVLPCGTGQCISVSDSQGRLTLIDCGISGNRNAAELVQEMVDWYNYEDIDMLILTAIDKTRARNVPELLATVPVNQIIIPSGCRLTKLYADIWDQASAREIPIQVWDREGEYTLADSASQTLSIIGGIDRKLIVRYCAENGNILILNSLTQKMLADYLSEHSITANTAILSETNIGDAEMFQDAMQQMEIQDIILESGYSQQTRIINYPARNTYLEGEIALKLRNPN